MKDMATKIMIGGIFGVDFEKEQRKNKIKTALLAFFGIIFFGLMMAWGMTSCIDDSYQDNHPVPKHAISELVN